jgi:selenocysteine-specific elongation factor
MGLKHGAEGRFHTGTSETTATAYLLEGDRAAGGTRAIVQIHLTRPVVAGPGDRFILRALSPVRTIGGGIVIEALEGKLRRSRTEVVEDAKWRAAAVRNDKDFAEYAVLSAADYAISMKAVAHRIKKTLPGTEKLLQDLARSGAVIALEQGLFIHVRTAEKLGLKALERLARHHQADPASPGMLPDAVAAEYGWDRPVAARVFGDLADAGKVRIQDGLACLAGHSVRFDSTEEKRLQTVERLFLERMFNPPEREELPVLCGLTTKETDNALRLLVEHRRLVRVDRNLHFHADAVAKAREIAVTHLRKENRLESVAWKYLLDTSRKYALPLLDYFDRIGVTKRAPDNTRHLGPKA